MPGTGTLPPASAGLDHSFLGGERGSRWPHEGQSKWDVNIRAPRRHGSRMYYRPDGSLQLLNEPDTVDHNLLSHQEGGVMSWAT